MRKRDELTNPNSSLNRAADDEFLFVLCGHDITTPATIRFWAAERIRRGKNRPSDEEIISAVLEADRIERVNKAAKLNVQ